MKRGVFGITLLLTISLIPAHAATPPKAGTTCSKAGLTRTYLGKKFTCIKSGKKLIWNKGLTIIKMNPSPTLSASLIKTFENQECISRYQIIRLNGDELLCDDVSGVLKWRNFIGMIPVSSSMSTSPTANPIPEDPYNNKPCTTEGEEIRLKNSTAPDYRCQKTSNGTLLWAKNNNIILVRPNSSSFTKLNTYTRTLTDKYNRPTIATDSVSNCKLVENSNPVATNVHTGFPLPQPYIKNIGKITMALVAIDFNDLPGEKDLDARINDQMTQMTNWYSMISEGMLKIEWKANKTWIRLAGKQSDYFVPRSGAYPETANLWKKLLEEVDPKIDFRGIQVVNFIMPNRQTAIPEGAQSFPWESEMSKYVSQEGPLYAFTLPGTFFEDYRRNIWKYWAHEFGHVLGFAHIGAQGSYEKPDTAYWDDILMYDMMGNQDGLPIGLLGWTRWLTSWLSDSQVFCTSTNSQMDFELTLVPSYSNVTGIKLALVKVSPTKVVAIESRRYNSFDCGAEELGNGVIAYSYDSTKGHDQASMRGAIPNGRSLIPYNSDCGPVTGTNGKVHNLSMYPGDSTVIEGVKIQVLRSGNFDVIRVQRN